MKHKILFWCFFFATTSLSVALVFSPRDGANDTSVKESIDLRCLGENCKSSEMKLNVAKSLYIEAEANTSNSSQQSPSKNASSLFNEPPPTKTNSAELISPTDAAAIYANEQRDNNWAAKTEQSITNLIGKSYSNGTTAIFSMPDCRASTCKISYSTAEHLKDTDDQMQLMLDFSALLSQENSLSQFQLFSTKSHDEIAYYFVRAEK